MAARDPVTELIEALEASRPTEQASGGKLAQAAELIPSRAGTSVQDLLASEELTAFRRQYAAGRVEAKVLDWALDLLRDILIGRGVIGL